MNKFIVFTLISVVFFGCAKLTPKLSKAMNCTIISPLIKISDAGFLHKFGNQNSVQIYSSGVNIVNLDIKNDKICLNNTCDDELIFNRKFFAKEHYKGLLSDILDFKPIYNSKHLIKTDCGFTQNISENSIQYQVCNKSLEFRDLKNSVKIKLKEVN